MGFKSIDQPGRSSEVGRNPKMSISLSTKWVDYVEEPMKYQALRPQFFFVDGWMVVGWGW